MYRSLENEDDLSSRIDESVASSDGSKFSRFNKKLFSAATRLLTSLLSCYPRSKEREPSPTIKEKQLSLEDLPNEIILLIISKCDFSSKMNMRAVNRRFQHIVDDYAHYLVRRNLIGGIEIRDVSPNSFEDASSTLTNAENVSLTLRRPLKRIELLLPAARLKNIMRHVCVCHSLNLRGVYLDEILASGILNASFRAISDVIVDRVHSVTADTLTKLIRKAYPTNLLLIQNHTSAESTDVIVPELLNACPAREINIASSISMIHSSFDDCSLVRLVLSDVVVRRVIRLPLCAITHHGIKRAAVEFYKRCCELIGETTDDMHSPVWEVSVSLPRSSLIDRNQINIPEDMKEQCTIWGYLPPHRDSFTVEVRVELMNLRILVETKA
ncbi:unnamed protein product [Auanema sp. JU1783]|nr:unnamed protein product [Auanema sp. JU1783]